MKVIIGSKGLNLNKLKLKVSYTSFFCCLADEEFEELCFDFGLELDEVVRARIMNICIISLYLGSCTYNKGRGNQSIEIDIGSQLISVEFNR